MAYILGGWIDNKHLGGRKLWQVQSCLTLKYIYFLLFHIGTPFVSIAIGNTYLLVVVRPSKNLAVPGVTFFVQFMQDYSSEIMTSWGPLTNFTQLFEIHFKTYFDISFKWYFISFSKWLNIWYHMNWSECPNEKQTTHYVWGNAINDFYWPSK